MPVVSAARLERASRTAAVGLAPGQAEQPRTGRKWLERIQAPNQPFTFIPADHDDTDAGHILDIDRPLESHSRSRPQRLIKPSDSPTDHNNVRQMTIIAHIASVISMSWRMNEICSRFCAASRGIYFTRSEDAMTPIAPATPKYATPMGRPTASQPNLTRFAMAP